MKQTITERVQEHAWLSGESIQLGIVQMTKIWP